MNITPAGNGGGESGASVSESDITDAVYHAQDLGKVAKGTSINFIGSIVRTALTFLYAIFLAAFLDQSDVGLFFLGFTVLTLLGTAATLGLDTGILRFTALYKGEGDNARVRGAIAGAVFVALPVSCVIAILLFLLSDTIAIDIFDKPDLAPLLKIFSPGIILFVLAKLFNSGTQGLRFMRYQVYSRDFGETLAKFVLSAVFMVAGFGVAMVVSANVTALLIAVLLSFTFLRRVMPVFGFHLERRYEQRRMLTYSFPIAGSTLLSLLLLWTDTILLGYFSSAEEVGVYSVAMRLAVVGTIIIVSFNTMFAPLASDFHNRGMHLRLERLFQSVTKWILALSLPFFAMLAIYAELALHVMGAQYTVGATALVVLAIGQLMNSAAGPVALLMMMCGRPRFVLLSNLIVFILDIVLCVTLIPRYGIEGAAMAFAITLILFNVGASIGVIFLLKLQPFSSGYARIVIGGTLATAIALILLDLIPGAAGYAISAVAFCLSYLLIVYPGSFNDSDMQLLDTIKRKLKG